jgi:glucose-6-phosphate 1-dehydrogenase
MALQESDALVFFGATGDLAFKKIFPSLQGLIRDEGFNLPIIGVSRSGSLDKLKERAKESLEQHGDLDQDAYQKLTELLRAVQGDWDKVSGSTTLPGNCSPAVP